jgi:Helix-turn-helix domain
MREGYEKFWAKVPEKAMHPVRVPLLEAFRLIGEPLSAIQLVNVLDGDVSMWEAAHHLEALKRLGVVEVEGTTSERWIRDDGFDIRYRVSARQGSDDGRRRA